MHRPTPCVGICSTTYGDLVCRGCKRFAHEIVQWNGYAEEQRERIRFRLAKLQVGALAQHVHLTDAVVLEEFLELPTTEPRSVEATGHRESLLLAQLLAHLRQHPDALLEIPGMTLISATLTPRSRAAELCRQVDEEFMDRSCAHYERNFKVPAV